MNPAKIRLSQKEMDLVTNADWILTKNAILQKTRQLLEQLSDEHEAIINTGQLSLPSETLHRPKITKGENYKGLPYLVLDYPRYFDKENVLAIRTMFWWGHFFSVTLQLSGQYKTQFESSILRAYELLKKKEMYYCISEDPWQHHFEESNYQPVNRFSVDSFTEMVRSSEFLKLSLKFPVGEWNNASGELLENFKFLLKLLNS